MVQTTRPLSPHLQVFGWQISNTLSIIHRATGVMLSAGAVVLMAWLVALASGQTAFLRMNELLGSLLGQLFLLGWTAAFFYHLCNGIRHLFWDAGYGYERADARRSGVIVVVVSLVLTLTFWAAALLGKS